ncbi:hypothetical protein NEPAR04_2395, partial [Nematocida parisii]
TMFLSGLPDKEAYACFKSLWSNAAPLDSMGITVEDFQDFVLAASYLDIQGEYAERFAENMVKYGLLGAHSADIVSSKDLSNYDLPQNTLWDFLHAFLRQTGFAYSLTHPSARQSVLRIERADAWTKKINEEYTGPSQTTRMRTVLYSELGPTGSQEKRRNEAVLSWLLQNMGDSSVDIQYTIEVFSDNTTDLSQTIQNLNKENEKGARVYVEGLILKIEYGSFIQHPSPQHALDLSRPELSIDRDYPTSKAAPFSLISTLSSCTSLKALTITHYNYILESAEVSILADSLPNIEQLSIWCKPLERTTVESLKKCVQLEKLEIDGWWQPNTTVQALLTQLPLLRELNINCQFLEPAAVEAFQACTKLERLKMHGLLQPSTAVQAIVTHLPSLRELSIWCNPLDLTAAEAFQGCTKLEKLEMEGDRQPSATVQALLTQLPLLRELSINCQFLEPAAVEAFQACAQLERLNMWGIGQPSTVVQAIVTHLPSLRELSIGCNPLYLAAAEAFQACTKLEKLRINSVPNHQSTTVQALVTHLPSLKYLRIGTYTADFALAAALRKCPNLHSLELTALQYTPGFLAHYLQAPRPRLKSLTLHNHDENHRSSEEDNRAAESACAEGICVWVR